MPKGIPKNGINKGWFKNGSSQPKTEEWKRKIGNGNRGKKRSEEYLKRISELRKVVLNRPEVKKKMSAAKLGKKQSAETIAKRIRRGAQHFNWNGGKSFEKYSVAWTKALKISIRERDKYTCQVCGEKQGEKTLSIHHIDYVKTNCNPDNLVSLCVSCHGKTNYKRNEWREFFRIKQHLSKK